MLTEGKEASKTYLAKSRPDVLDCAATAFVGMELRAGFWSSFTTRRAILRVVGRLAARTLGFLGAALIVYDFADCMWN